LYHTFRDGVAVSQRVGVQVLSVHPNLLADLSRVTFMVGGWVLSVFPSHSLSLICILARIAVSPDISSAQAMEPRITTSGSDDCL